MNLTKRELVHVLAALRLCEASQKRELFAQMPHFHAAGVVPLTNIELDWLCERMNHPSPKGLQELEPGGSPEIHGNLIAVSSLGRAREMLDSYLTLERSRNDG